MEIFACFVLGYKSLEQHLAHRKHSNICRVIEFSKLGLSVDSVSGFVLSTGNKMENGTQSLTTKIYVV
jgi:L-aminopeptidase/D-esterase-like protein